MLNGKIEQWYGVSLLNTKLGRHSVIRHALNIKTIVAKQLHSIKHRIHLLSTVFTFLTATVFVRTLNTHFKIF